MNDTIKTQLDHRTIRAWLDKEIPEDKVQELLDVAIQTSTSNGMQQASIIRVKDTEKRERLAKITTQDYIITASEVFVFIADNYRNYKIMEEMKAENNYANDIDRFFQGFTDAAIMAQNVAVAAESMDLGIVYFGSILNDVEETINILKLPENTFPVVAMGIGYPDKTNYPQLKPRIDKENRVFTDEYKTYDSYLDELEEYDKVMRTYYDTRDTNPKEESFTEQVYNKNSVQVAKRPELLEIIKKQAYQI